jgi:hypothetical protein
MRKRPRQNRFPLLCGLAPFFCAFFLFSQERPDRPPWAQPSGQAKSADGQAKEKNQDQNSSRNAIKVNVNLVNVLVSVLDEYNRPAPDLPIEAFQVFEEGLPQKIDIFEAETKWPLDLALMIDSSLSAHMEKTFERDAASHFI